MTVWAQYDRMGNITLAPVSTTRQRRIVRAAIANGAPADFDGTVFLQEGAPVAEYLESSRMSRQNRAELDKGWPVMTRIDSWEYDVMAGYCDS